MDSTAVERLRALPGMGLLLASSALTIGRRGEATADKLIAHYEAAPLSSAWLRDYAAYFGGFVSPVPLTALYPLAQRAQLALMLRGEFPYAVPGMVHVSNEMAWLGPLEPGAGYTLEVGVALPTERESGVRLGFEVTVMQSGVARATCRSVYLARRGRSGRGGGRSLASEAPQAHGETWHLGADEGRRYAALSGDYNPIHLSPWTSRLFGFKQPIMHGMDAVGRVASAIEREAGIPLAGIDAAFKRPVYLPAEVRLAWGPEGAWVVESADGTTRHMEGGYSL